MTSRTPTVAAPIPPPSVPPAGGRTGLSEVVAGLVNDGSARRVASAGRDYAVAHGMALSFVHVVPDDVLHRGAEDVGDTTFAAVLDVLRGHGRLHCAFEVVRGDPQRALVERSRTAGLLVVGSDDSSPHASIAEYCRDHALCEVLTVDVSGDRLTPSST